MIVPPTEKDPLLVNAVLPMTVITEPDATEKAFVELTEPPVIVHEEPVRDRVLFANIDDDAPSAKVLLPVNKPSDTKSWKLSASVREPPETPKYQNRTVDALLPSVLAVESRVVAMLLSVTFLAAPSAPPHLSGTVNVVTGGTHRVEPDAMVMSDTCAKISGVA